MANLDSENKRRSAVGIVGLMTILPLADGSIAQADRQQAAAMYCCIAAGEPAVITPIMNFITKARTRHFTIQSRVRHFITKPRTRHFDSGGR